MAAVRGKGTWRSFASNFTALLTPESNQQLSERETENTKEKSALIEGLKSKGMQLKLRMLYGPNNCSSSSMSEERFSVMVATESLKPCPVRNGTRKRFAALTVGDQQT